MFFDVFFGECAFFEEFVDVDVQGGFLVLDDVVHSWLGEGWLVCFVVALFAVTDDIDDDVRFELLAPVCGELMDKCDCFGIIAVDVKDRTIVRFTDIRCIGGRSSESRISGESNLIVHDNMHCSSTAS